MIPARMSLAEERVTALKVAKWLVGKGRADEAVTILCAYAAQGDNDTRGQELMAEALRINPGAPIARLAFERMEGVPGDHGPLDEAIKKYNAAEIDALAKQIARPNFIRAQVGFNNNVKYKDHVFHIQTEDSGLDRPHIITHLFADGGRIIKSHKRGYSEHVQRDDVAAHVRSLMKGQHVEMAIMLREGRFDAIIAGQAIGGMETMTEPPRAEVKKMAGRGDDAPNTKAKPKVVFKVQGDDPPPASKAEVEAAAPKGPDPMSTRVAVEPEVTAPPVSARAAQAKISPKPPVVAAPVSDKTTYIPPYRLSVERSCGGDPAFYEPKTDTMLIGTAGEVRLAKDRFCHPSEARLEWRHDRLFLKDLPGGNGAFIRVQHLMELEPGDEFIVGDQLLRVDRNPDPYDDGPTTEPTYFYSSPKPALSPFRVTQIFEGRSKGACVLARGNSVQIGVEGCDLNFTKDPLVSKQHCILEEQAGVIILTDLDSRTGVFVRVTEEQELMHGDEIIVGRSRLKVETLSRIAKSARG